MAVDTSGFSAALDGVVARVNAAAEEISRRGALMIEAAAKARSPVKTGTLRRSIVTKPLGASSAGVYTTQVGPTVIYARRVELGFRGADSLRRVYNQPGRPYFRPGVDETVAAIGSMAETTWTAAIGG